MTMYIWEFTYYINCNWLWIWCVVFWDGQRTSHFTDIAYVINFYSFYVIRSLVFNNIKRWIMVHFQTFSWIFLIIKELYSTHWNKCSISVIFPPECEESFLPIWMICILGVCSKITLSRYCAIHFNRITSYHF